MLPTKLLVKGMAMVWQTRTKTGLIVKAMADENIYEKGIKVSGEEL